MRKVLLFLVVSFIVMGTLGAHAIIPDSATVEVPTPESEYSQDTDVQSEDFAEPEPIVMEPAVDEVTEQTSDEMSAVDSETSEEMVVEPFNVVNVETETTIMEPAVDEVTEQVSDEMSVADSEASEETVAESINDADVESEVSAKPELVVVEPLVDEVAEQTSDKLSDADSESPEEMVAEPFNVVDVEPEPIAMEPVVDEVVEQVTDEVSVVDSEQVEETAVVETFNDVDVELEGSVEPESSADPELVAVEPLVDEATEQSADELAAADPEQADSLLVETENIAEDEESESTPYVEDMEENVAETEVSEPVVADIEPAGDDTEDGQTVMDIVPDEAGDNDMKSVDVQAEEDEPLVESDESDKKSGINGKVLLSMEATHFAWNFSSNGGGYGLALPCSGVSAEWLFSNRFACGFDVRVSTESDGTSYRTNLGILNRFGMLSAVKNFLNEANVVFFKGDVLLGLTIKDAVGGIATLPTIGLGGSVHFGRDFLTMAFGVDGTVMFPLSGADRAPVCSIRPNMSLTWIL